MPGMLLISADLRPASLDILVLIWASPLLSPGIMVPPIGKMRIIDRSLAENGLVLGDFGYNYEAVFSPITPGYCIWTAVQAVSGDPNSGGFFGGVPGKLVYCKSNVI